MVSRGVIDKAMQIQKQESKKCWKFVDFKQDASPRGVLEIPILESENGNTSSVIRSGESDALKSGINGPDLVSESHSCHRIQWKGLMDMLKKKSSPKPRNHELFQNALKKLSKLKLDSDEAFRPTLKPSWRSFELSELAVATDNFSPDNLIGKGGNGEVYRGCLPDGQLVAVKKLIIKNDEEHKTSDFLAELGIIGHINHLNTARLIGFSVDGGLHLVLQLAHLGSLSSVLHEINLPWDVRFKVAIGVAEGLRYLHCECQRRIIHRDIKSSNILLTKDFQPQISDFGLAKWLPKNWAYHVLYPIEGTFGYLSPEYFMHGIASEKSDVFAFGVILLELITGRYAIDSSGQSLVIWARPLLKTNRLEELVDPILGNRYDHVEMKRTMSTASMCIHNTSTKRPYMNQAVQMLKGEDVTVETKQKPGGRELLLDTIDLECSTHLNDLNRHMQLVLE